MVVEWKNIEVVDVVVEGGGEPDVLGDDLRGCLDGGAGVLLEFGETPAGITSRAGFLSDGESNTGFKGTDSKGTFAVTGASRHSDLGNVNVGGGSSLKDIDDT